MRRTVEFGVFAAVAALLHLAALQAFESGAPVVAGAPGHGGPTVTGATGELAELIESWAEAPDATEPEELAIAEPADIGPEAPLDMEAPEMEAPTAETAASRPVAVPPQEPPPVLNQTRLPELADAQVDVPAPLPAPSAPVPAALAAKPETALALPESPLATPLPSVPVERLREAEPGPDPNEVPEIGSRHLTVAPKPSPEVETVPDRPVGPAPPTTLIQPEAIAPPEIGVTRETEPEPTPAPVIAAMPTPKPDMPESAPSAAPRQTPVHEPKPEPARAQPAPNSARRAEPAPEAPTAPQFPSATDDPAAPPGGGWDALEQSALPGDVGSTAKAGAKSAPGLENAREAWLTEVRRAVQREKKYPRWAERRGIEGRSAVRITLDAGGRLTGAILAGSSGEAVLDEAAMAAVRNVGRFPPIPPEMRKASVTITLPFEFRRR